MSKFVRRLAITRLSLASVIARRLAITDVWAPPSPRTSVSSWYHPPALGGDPNCVLTLKFQKLILNKYWDFWSCKSPFLESLSR